ncbi:MAG: hypothetical protein ACYCS9_04675 [Candidatus Dormibacteria bacterium]
MINLFAARLEVERRQHEALEWAREARTVKEARRRGSARPAPSPSRRPVSGEVPAH